MVKCIISANIEKIILSLVLIAQLSLIYACALNKECLFIDELWSFNLANGSDILCLGDASSVFYKWHYYNFWQSLLIVNKEHCFNYVNVYFNQAADVHPPLYYAVLHTVCSIFPEQFSKWYAIMPNMVAFIIIQVLLFKISCYFMKDNMLKFLPVIWYGFSAAAVNIVTFMRMYSLLTLWCLLLVYLSVNIPKEEEKKNRYFIYLGITVLCGVLTHYYFVIFLFFMLLWYGRYLYLTYHKWFFKHYVVTVCYACMSAVIFYPYMLKHIFGIGSTGYRGVQSFYMLCNASFFEKAKLLLYGIDEQLMFNGLGLFTCVLMYSVVLGVYRQENDSNLLKLVALLVATLSCFTVVAQICVYTNIKYISYIFPLIVLSIVTLFYNTSKNWPKFILKGIMLVMVIMCFDSAYNLLHSTNIHNQKFKATVELLQGEYKGVPMLSVNKAAIWDPFMNQVQLLASVERSYVVKYTDLEKLELNEEKIVVSINSDCYYEIPKIEDIFKQKGYRMVQQLIGASTLHELNVFIYAK